MESLNPERLIAIISSATEEVFSTMLGMSVRPGEHHMEKESIAPFDGVVALVGLTGACVGAARISTSSAMACRLSGAMLASEYAAVNEDVLDAMGELANMIIGNVKSPLEEELGPMGISIPTVIFGRNYKARSSAVQEWVVVSFACDDDRMEVRFALMPASKADANRSNVMQLAF